MFCLPNIYGLCSKNWLCLDKLVWSVKGTNLRGLWKRDLDFWLHALSFGQKNWELPWPSTLPLWRPLTSLKALEKLTKERLLSSFSFLSWLLSGKLFLSIVLKMFFYGYLFFNFEKLLVPTCLPLVFRVGLLIFLSFWGRTAAVQLAIMVQKFNEKYSLL